jgi:hypothetical protein
MLKKLQHIIIAFASFFCFSFGLIQSEVEEYAAKAAFIYNFTKFVEWQDNSLNTASTFNIGVLGDSPITGPLNDLASSKKINNKRINIIRYNSASEINNCHILFIPENASSELVRTSVQSPSVKNTLIISERKGLLESGSAINFLIVNNKIRFEVNLSSLNRSNIKASSQLLKLALNIKN